MSQYKIEPLAYVLIMLGVLLPVIAIYDDMPLSVSDMRKSVAYVECVIKDDNNYTYETSGSAVVISEDGNLITNAHVVEQCVSDITVELDGVEYIATTLKVSDKVDLALISIEATDLRAIKLDLTYEVGDTVYAIGSPLGIQDITSKGIVSGMYKMDEEHKYIVHDASIFPGNSGGALMSKEGNLLGVNSASIVITGGSMSLAIGADDILDFINE